MTTSAPLASFRQPLQCNTNAIQTTTTNTMQNLQINARKMARVLENGSTLGKVISGIPKHPKSAVSTSLLAAVTCLYLLKKLRICCWGGGLKSPAGSSVCDVVRHLLPRQVNRREGDLLRLRHLRLLQRWGVGREPDEQQAGRSPVWS